MDDLTRSVTDLLELNNIDVCLLPPNTTDRLQPMDASVNKRAKDNVTRLDAPRECILSADPRCKQDEEAGVGSGAP